MLIIESRNGLDLYNDQPMTNEIWPKDFFELFLFVCQRQFWRGDEWYRLHLELDLKALLVDRLDKAASLLAIHLKTSPHDGIAFLLKHDFHAPFPFVSFAYFVVYLPPNH